MQILPINKKLKFRDVYELMEHGRYLFCKCVVGLQIKEPLHREGFVYQNIRDGNEDLHFIYTRLKFSPFIWSRKKLDQYLEELFSFVPPDIVVEDHTPLERFNQGLQAKHLSYPIRRRFEEGEEGVFFITPRGKELLFLKGKGKPIRKKATLTLFHPLCPLPALL